MYKLDLLQLLSTEFVCTLLQRGSPNFEHWICLHFVITGVSKFWALNLFALCYNRGIIYPCYNKVQTNSLLTSWRRSPAVWLYKICTIFFYRIQFIFHIAHKYGTETVHGLATIILLFTDVIIEFWNFFFPKYCFKFLFDKIWILYIVFLEMLWFLNMRIQLSVACDIC